MRILIEELEKHFVRAISTLDFKRMSITLANYAYSVKPQITFGMHRIVKLSHLLSFTGKSPNDPASRMSCIHHVLNLGDLNIAGVNFEDLLLACFNLT